MNTGGRNLTSNKKALLLAIDAVGGSGSIRFMISQGKLDTTLVPGRTEEAWAATAQGLGEMGLVEIRDVEGTGITILILTERGQRALDRM